MAQDVGEKSSKVCRCPRCDTQIVRRRRNKTTDGEPTLWRVSAYDSDTTTRPTDKQIAHYTLLSDFFREKSLSGSIFGMRWDPGGRGASKQTCGIASICGNLVLEARKAKFEPANSESLREAGCRDVSTWVFCTSVAAIQQRVILLLSRSRLKQR